MSTTRRNGRTTAKKTVNVIGLYARISSEDKDPDTGELLEESVGDQMRRLREEAARRWPSAAVKEFIDNNISASEFARNSRPEWERMLKALAAGEIDGVLTVHEDRLTRRVDESFDFRKALLAHDGILVTLDGGEKNIEAEGGVSWYLNAIMSSKSSFDTSRRVRDKLTLRREDGIVVSTRPAFGYADTRYTIHVPEQVAVLEECREAIMAGKSVRHCVRLFDAAGFTSPYRKAKDGKPQGYTRNAVHGMLRNAVYAGFVVHQGERVRRSTNVVPVWTVAEFDALQEALDKNASESAAHRTAAPTNGRVHLLTGFLRCGKCGAGCRIYGRRGEQYWGCIDKSEGGCAGVRRRYTLVASVVDAFVRARLEQQRITVTEATRNDPERVRIEQEIRKLEKRATELAAAFADPDYPLSAEHHFQTLRQVSDGITTRRAALARMVREAVRVLPPDALATWEDERPETLHTRRQMVASLVEGVVIMPVGQKYGVRGAPPESVRVFARRDVPQERAS